MLPDALDLSLNEVETLALKAARGAGLPWGLAEDAGRAAVWMTRHAGAWTQGLLAVLDATGETSPLLLGGWLADGVGEAGSAGPAMAPVWALPGLLATGRSVMIRLDATEVVGNPEEAPTASVPIEDLVALRWAVLSVSFPSGKVRPLAHALPLRFQRSRVALADWRLLDALAQRTYVPASDRSRLTGAGAGLLDDE